jgi:hypothetical protein
MDAPSAPTPFNTVLRETSTIGQLLDLGWLHVTSQFQQLK